MTLPVDEHIRAVCRDIVADRRLIDDWAATESDDEIQTDRVCGGFDATEMAFCFSYYDDSGREYWFQLSFDQVGAIARGEVNAVEVHRHVD